MIKMLLGQIRHDKHMTLKELERRTGISNSQLSDIEHGKVSPTIYTLCKIANGLDLCVTDLFIDTEYENKRNIRQKSKCDTCICYRTFLKYDAEHLSDEDSLPEF